MKKLTVLEKLSKIDKKFLKSEIIKSFEETEFEKINENEIEILNFNDIHATQLHLTGGKGSNLSLLNSIKGVNVPPFFCVTTNVFNKMIKKYKIDELIEKLDLISNDFKKNQKEIEKFENLEDLEKKKIEIKKIESKISEIAKKIRKNLLEIKFDDDFIEKIELNYKKLSELENIENLSVAIRSSGCKEDLENASFAGLHSTYLNQKGLKDIIHSILKCWGSVFSDIAIEYRNYLSIEHKLATISVVVQRMIFPDSAGTAFSIEIGTSFPGLHLAISNGLGESLVSGEVTSDEFLIDKNNFNLIKRTLGSKKIQYKILEKGSGIEKVDLSEDQRKKYCIDINTAKEISKTLQDISEVFKNLFGYENVDTEFAISKNKKIYFLQCRAVCPVFYDKFITVDKNDINPDDVIAKGRYSLIGCCYGRINIVEKFDDLISEKVKIEKDDIITTVKTSNYWNQFLVNIKGIICSESSPTAHPMLIGRERKFPVVCGIDDCIERLKPYNHQFVTMDGITKCIYKGKKKTTEATNASLEEQFKTIEIEKPQEEQESLKFLISFGRAIKDEKNDVYVANPNHPLCNFLLEISKNSLKNRENLINAAKDPKNIQNISVIDNRFVIKDSMIYDKFQELKSILRVFENMKIEECEKFYNNSEDCIKNILKLAEKFELNLENFEKYVELMENFTSYMWISFFFRFFLNIQTSKIGNELGISKFHFEQFSKIIQKEIVEEDNVFRLEILKFSKKIVKFLKEKKIELKNLNIEEVRKNDELYFELKKLSRSFKILKSTDMIYGAPIKECLKKVIDEINLTGEEKIENLIFEKEVKENEEFFPENENFRRFLRLSIFARVQHCNFHHFKMRSQFKIRKYMKKLSKKVFGEENKLKIFDCSIDEIKNFLKNN